MKRTFLLLGLLLGAAALWAAVPLTGGGKIENVAGVPGKRGFSGDQSDADKARLASPLGLAVDRWHNLYIADTLNHRVRRVDARSGYIDTVAGTDRAGFFNDGGHADQAGLKGPTALAFDGYGNLYIADTGNQRIRVLTRKGYLYTVAGNGRKGYEGEGAKARSTALNNPTGLAVSNAGELYIADTGNHRIRKVDRVTGLLTTVAGTGDAGDDGDGGLAINAQLDHPSGIVFDKYDNLYIVDTRNHKIRFVDRRGKRIFTLAGSGDEGYCGDNSGTSPDACFNDPTGIALDRFGRVYVADTDNQRVRRISIDLKRRTSQVETVAGSGRRGYNGDDMDAWQANLAYPGALAISGLDMLYFLDTGNNVVRRVQNISAVRPPTSYTAFGKPVEEVDSRNFYEVLFKPVVAGQKGK